MQRQSALLQPTPRFTLPARAICERWVRYTRRESSGEWMCVGWLANTSQEQDRGAGATRTCLGWSRSNIPGCCTDFRVRVRCGDTRRFATQMGSSAMSARRHVCVETCLAMAQVSPVNSISHPNEASSFFNRFSGMPSQTTLAFVLHSDSLSPECNGRRTPGSCHRKACQKRVTLRCAAPSHAPPHGRWPGAVWSLRMRRQPS